MKVLLKIPLVLAAFFIFYFVAIIGVERGYIRPRFESLERAASSRDLDRVLAAIRKEADHLDIVGRDWSQWDDTWQFAAGRNPGFVGTNLGADAFQIIDAAIIAIYGSDGKKRYGERFDAAAGTVVPDNLFPFQAPHDAPYLAPGSDGTSAASVDGDADERKRAPGSDGFVYRPVVRTETVEPRLRDNASAARVRVRPARSSGPSFTG